MILFPRGAGAALSRFRDATGAAGLSLDSSLPLDWAARRAAAAAGGAGQSRSDRCCWPAARHCDREVTRILDGLGKGRFIFNLGHGILPETPLAHVERAARAGPRRDAA